MKTIKEQFIDKWSTWFMFNKEAELLKKGMVKELEKVIAEHDQEIIQVIDEMIFSQEKVKKNIESITTKKDYQWWDAEMRIKSLTELKEKLEQK